VGPSTVSAPSTSNATSSILATASIAVGVRRVSSASCFVAPPRESRYRITDSLLTYSDKLIQLFNTVPVHNRVFNSMPSGPDLRTAGAGSRVDFVFQGREYRPYTRGYDGRAYVSEPVRF